MSDFFYVHDAELMSIMTLSLEFHPLSLTNKYTLPKRSGNKAIMLIFTASALLWRERHTKHNYCASLKTE